MQKKANQRKNEHNNDFDYQYHKFILQVHLKYHHLVLIPMKLL